MTGRHTHAGAGGAGAVMLFVSLDLFLLILLCLTHTVEARSKTKKQTTQFYNPRFTGISPLIEAQLQHERVMAIGIHGLPATQSEYNGIYTTDPDDPKNTINGFPVCQMPLP